MENGAENAAADCGGYQDYSGRSPSLFQGSSSRQYSFIPTQVEVQIITMEPKIPQEEIERVKKTLRDYTERVTSGEIAFSTLARLYSEDEGSRRRGGELGFMGRAELVPEYANVAFNLQDPNKVSKIVESEFGFHIIQLIEKRGDRINTRHILLKPKVDEKIWKQPCYVWILLPMISVMRNLLLMMPLLISLTIRTRVTTMV